MDQERLQANSSPSAVGAEIFEDLFPPSVEDDPLRRLLTPSRWPTAASSITSRTNGKYCL
jgi:hypothetical protein